MPRNILRNFWNDFQMLPNAPSPITVWVFSLFSAMSSTQRSVGSGFSKRKHPDIRSQATSFNLPAKLFSHWNNIKKPTMNSKKFSNFAHSAAALMRSEEHTSELQSRGHIVCRLL